MKNILLATFLLFDAIVYSQTDTSIISNLAENNNSWDLNILLAAFIGSFMQEFIYWFELRSDIANGKNPPELMSKTYWVITTIAIIIFSLSSFLYFNMLDQKSSFLTIAIFSAGFPRIFKSLVSKVTELPQVKPKTIGVFENTFSINNYLMKKSA